MNKYIMRKAREKYYLNKANKHQEAADYHLDMVDRNIHPEYHQQQAEYHLNALEDQREDKENKSKEKPEKKDIGPMNGSPTLTSGGI